MPTQGSLISTSNIDTVVTANSTNLITSGAVHTALANFSGGSASGNYLPLTGGTLTGDLYLKTGNANYGSVLYFGDTDYVHISEPEDDVMEMKSSSLRIIASNIMRKYSSTDYNQGLFACGEYVADGTAKTITIGFRPMGMIFFCGMESTYYGNRSDIWMAYFVNFSKSSSSWDGHHVREYPGVGFPSNKIPTPKSRGFYLNANGMFNTTTAFDEPYYWFAWG